MSVFFYGCVTLDGYLADKNHNLDWLHQTGTTEETDYESFYQGIDITIMGRRTFREIEKAEDPQALYPTTRNYVFTHARDLSCRGFTPSMVMWWSLSDSLTKIKISGLSAGPPCSRRCWTRIWWTA